MAVPAGDSGMRVHLAWFPARRSGAWPAAIGWISGGTACMAAIGSPRRLTTGSPAASKRPHSWRRLHPKSRPVPGRTYPGGCHRPASAACASPIHAGTTDHGRAREPACRIGGNGTGNARPPGSSKEDLSSATASSLITIPGPGTGAMTIWTARPAPGPPSLTARLRSPAAG